MRRDGLKLTFFGLLLGVVIGSGILAVKSFVAQQLVLLLEDMVVASTDGCHFRVDAISFSIFNLSVTARRPRMECNGRTELAFRALEGDFDLTDIRNHRIYLNRLTLRDGMIEGGTPGTNPYRFINYLAAPVPPERDSPDRWKLKLRELILHSTKIAGNYRGAGFEGLSDRFTILRTPSNDFRFTGDTKVILQSALLTPTAQPVELGTLRVDFLATDTELTVDQATLDLPNGSRMAIRPLTLDLRSDQLSGQAEYQLTLNALPGLPAWLQGALGGKGTIQGIGAEAMIQSTLRLGPGPLLIGSPTSPAFELSTGQAELSAAAEGQNAFLSVSALAAEGPATRIALRQPIRISPSGLRGALDLELSRISAGGVSAEGVLAHVTLGGTPEAPSLNIQSSTKSFRAGDVWAKGVLLSGSITPEQALLRVTSDTRSVDGDLAVRFRSSGPPVIERGKLTLSRAELYSASRNDSARLIVNGDLALSGPLSRQAIRADGVISLELPTTPVVARFRTSVKDGVLTAELQNATRSLTSALTLPIAENGEGAFFLTLRDLSIAEVTTGLDCLTTDLTLSYRFSPHAETTGNGELAVQKLIVGCAPNDLRLLRGIQLPIRAGTLDLSGLGVQNGPASIRLAGKINLQSGFDLGLIGELNLESLAKLLPAVDDLRGQLTTRATLKGPIAEPTWTGSAKIEDGGLASESMGVAVSSVTGGFQLNNDGISIENVRGELNGGKISLTGNINPANIQHSLAALSFDGVTISPADNASVTLSGNIELSGISSDMPVLRGLIRVESGEVRRRLDLRTVVAFLSQLALERARSLSATRTLPRVELDLQLQASRNLFVITNWASAELDADLAITGDLATPLVRGQVRTLSGWVGIKDHRFEITSGRVRFEPGLPEPELELLGEATARSALGESVIISLDVRGPVSDPRVTLTSDSGLSQKEIIQILTISGNASRQTRANAWYTQFDDDVRSEPFALTRFLRSLARIDILSLEPAYNPTTGNYEPTIIARKEVSDRFSLHASSALAGAGSALIEGVYSLSPSVNLSGGIESERARQQSALIADLTYTIRARHQPFLRLTVQAEQIDSQEILDGLRLGDTSRVPSRDLGRIERQLVEWCVARGFRDAQASVACEEDGGLCREMTVRLTEGTQHTVEGYEFAGDSPSALIGRDPVPFLPPTALATEARLEDVREKITRALRSEGHLAARVSTSYVPGTTATSHRLRIDVAGGAPVTFLFEGNRRFSSEDFLSTINLFKRRQPFGNNTIQILLENIDRLYREDGYLYATMSERSSRDETSGRVTHTISIREDSPVPVSQVVIAGGDIPEERLRALLYERYPEEVDAIFAPEFAVEEVIESHAHLIKEVYAEDGYPAASVTFQLAPQEAAHTVEIHYSITSGAALRGERIAVEGLPTNLPPVEAPQPPYSIPKMNRFSSRLLTTLTDSGYVNAAVRTDYDPEHALFRAVITPGEQVKIRSIRIQGTRNIDEGILRRNLALHVDDPWDDAMLLRARRTLLQLGLFSRVELVPVDGLLDSAQEDLLVRVEERPLTSVEVGAGMNSEYGVHIFGEATDRDLFRDGRTLSLRVDTYYDEAQTGISQGTASLRFVHPGLSGSPLRLTEDLRYEKVERSTQEYDLEQSALASYLTYPFSEKLTATVGHTLALQDITSVPDDIILSSLDRGNVRIGLMSAGVTYDGRDDPLRPTRGFASALEARLSAPALGSEASFVGTSARFSFIQPLGGALTRWSFANASRAGALWPLSGTTDIPVTQRLYLGGRASVRGFRENSLGPRGEFGNVIGGDLLLANAFELRFAWSDELSWHTFLDAGSVFLKDRSVDWQDLRFSTGLGLQYLSPIGPIGLDVGHPIDEAEGEPSWRLHFSVGSTF